MKIYLIGHNWFDCEKKLLRFIASEKIKGNDLEKYQLKIVETVDIIETNANSYLESDKKQKELDTKLNVVLGDDFSQKVQKFKQLFDTLSENNVLDKNFKIKLDSTPIEKKAFSRLLSSNVGYLFYFNTSVEWYRAILDIHNFKKIEDFYYRPVLYKTGQTGFSNVKVNDDAKQNFNIAKSMSKTKTK